MIMKHLLYDIVQCVHAYLLKELDVFGEASVLLLETAQDLVSHLTHMLLQRIATVKTLPKTKQCKKEKNKARTHKYQCEHLSTLVVVYL